MAYRCVRGGECTGCNGGISCSGSKPVYTCSDCEEEIYEEEPYYDIGSLTLCENCMEERSTLAASFTCDYCGEYTADEEFCYETQRLVICQTCADDIKAYASHYFLDSAAPFFW